LNDALRTVLAVQQLIEAEFQALLALVIDSRESDHMAGYFARRIIAAILAQQVHAGNAQRLDARRLFRRHMTLQIEKFAIEIAGDAPRQCLLVILERARELRQLIDVVR